MFKQALCTTVVLVLCGCAAVNKQVLSADSTASMRGQTIAVTQRPTQVFTAMTPARAAFGMLGALAMLNEGKAIVATYELTDPAAGVAEGMATLAAGNYGMEFSSAPVAVDTRDVAQIAARAGSARYVVDVETSYWAFTYFNTDWTHYRVAYGANARLIDVRQKAVLAAGRCWEIPESNANAPTYDAMLANSAAILKTQLAAAGRACIEALKKDMFPL
jgi:hypothetical protein